MRLDWKCALKMKMGKKMLNPKKKKKKKSFLRSTQIFLSNGNEVVVANTFPAYDNIPTTIIFQEGEMKKMR